MNIKSFSVIALGALILLACSASFGAEEYTKGHGALEVFDAEGMALTPLWVRLWVGFMLLMFATGLFVFAWKQPAARWVAGGFIVSATTGAMVFNALGLPFLSGSIAIMHLVCWMPGLIYLVIKRPFLDEAQGRWFRVWSGTMLATILFSFVFDLRDAYIYISHIS